MSNKFVGPIGKELRGNRERAAQLIGPTRLMVQRALDKIEARGGKGSQLEQWRTADGCVVWAYVIKETETPIVRVFIECPGGEEMCVPRLVDMALLYNDDTHFYFMQDGTKRVPAPDYWLPRYWWIGKYQDKALILIDNWGQFVVGNTPVATDISSSSLAKCLRTFTGENGGDYWLTAHHVAVSPDEHELHIYGAPVLTDEVSENFQKLWIIKFEDFHMYYATLNFAVFSATGSKIAYARKSSDTVYKAYEATIPGIYPEVNEGVPVVTTIWGTSLYERAVVDITETAEQTTTDIGAENAEPWKSIGTNAAFFPYAQFYDTSYSVNGSWLYSLIECRGMFYEDDALHLVKETIDIDMRVSGRQYEWAYNGHPYPGDSWYAGNYAYEDERVSLVGTIPTGVVGCNDIDYSLQITVTATLDFGTRSETITLYTCSDRFIKRLLYSTNLYSVQLWQCKANYPPYYEYLGYTEPVFTTGASSDEEGSASMNQELTKITWLIGESYGEATGVAIGPVVQVNESFVLPEEWSAYHTWKGASNIIELASSIDYTRSVKQRGEHLFTEQGSVYDVTVMDAPGTFYLDNGANFYIPKTFPLYLVPSFWAHAYLNQWSDVRWPDWIQSLYPPNEVPPNAGTSQLGVYTLNNKVFSGPASVWPAQTCWPQKKRAA